MARGVWEGNWVLFDNCINDADAPSYVKANLSWDAIPTHAASAKKAKYRLAAEELRGSFTPLVCSTDGVSPRHLVAKAIFSHYVLGSYLDAVHNLSIH